MSANPVNTISISDLKALSTLSITETAPKKLLAQQISPRSLVAKFNSFAVSTKTGAVAKEADSSSDSHVLKDRVAELVSDAVKVKDDAKEADLRRDALESSLAELQVTQKKLRETDAPSALDEVIRVVNLIQSLRESVENAKQEGKTDDQIAQDAAVKVEECKAQSQVVLGQLQSLQLGARDVMKNSSQLSADLESLIVSTKTRTDDLQNLKEVATTLKAGIDTEKGGLKSELEITLQRVDQVEKAKETMESTLESLDNPQIQQTVSNLGIEKLLNIGNLDKEIAVASSVIANEKVDSEESKKRIKRADEALARVNEETTSLSGIGRSTKEQKGILEKDVEECKELSKAAMSVIEASLGVTIYLAILAAKKGEIELKHDAQDLAQSLEQLAKALGAEDKVKDLLLIRDPSALQKALDMIAGA